MRPAARTWRAPYRSTTRHAQALYPFLTDAGLGADGVLIGRDMLHRPFCYDPFRLYERGRLNGPNLLILGDIGYGKSSLVKTYLYRQACFGAVPLVIDVKGEYDRLCAALDTQPIRFATGGDLRLNPLDEQVAGPDRLGLLRALAELLSGQPLRPRAGAALEQAWTTALQAATQQHRQPLLPEVITCLLRPTPHAAHALEATVAQLTDWGRDVAFALRRLCGTGDLAGMLDGPTSPGLALDGHRPVSVNLAHVADPAKPALMACVAAWLKQLWARGDGTRRILVQEEAWHLLASPTIAALTQANFKLARQYGVQNVIVLHHLGDLRAAGDTGSRTAQLAEGLLADAATRVLYHLDPGELAQTAELLGLNHAHRTVIPHLGRGSALWLVGPHALVVHHQLAPPPSLEPWITNTDHAMHGLGTREAEVPPHV